MQVTEMDALATTPFATDPWRHLYLADALPAGYAARLARTFPADRLTPTARSGSDKDYRLWTADLTDAVGLPEPWDDFLRLLGSDAHRDLLARRSGVDLSGTRVTLTVWEYRGGDFLAPHVDKEEKVLTQIVYLGEQWAEGDGGRLLVQRTPDPDDVVSRLSPTLGATAVLVRSDHSWHSVESPRPGAAPRRSLNLTYWA